MCSYSNNNSNTQTFSLTEYKRHISKPDNWTRELLEGRHDSYLALSDVNKYTISSHFTVVALSLTQLMSQLFLEVSVICRLSSSSNVRTKVTHVSSYLDYAFGLRIFFLMCTLLCSSCQRRNGELILPSSTSSLDITAAYQSM